MNIKPFRKHERSAASIGLAGVEAELMSVLSIPRDLDEEAERRRERELGMVPTTFEDCTDATALYAPPAVIPLPDYVQHSPETTPTGAACGEAIVKEYELAAKEIEALGEELMAAHARTEERQRALAQALASLKETAKAYREEAKRVFEEVEARAAMAEEVSKTCEEIRTKIGKQ